MRSSEKSLKLFTNLPFEAAYSIQNLSLFFVLFQPVLKRIGLGGVLKTDATTGAAYIFVSQ